MVPFHLAFRCCLSSNVVLVLKFSISLLQLWIPFSRASLSCSRFLAILPILRRRLLQPSLDPILVRLRPGFEKVLAPHRHMTKFNRLTRHRRIQMGLWACWRRLLESSRRRRAGGLAATSDGTVGG